MKCIKSLKGRLTLIEDNIYLVAIEPEEIQGKLWNNIEICLETYTGSGNIRHELVDEYFVENIKKEM